MSNDDNWANDFDDAAAEGLIEDPRFMGGDDGFGELDTEGVDTADIGSGDARFRVKIPGWYHFALKATAKPAAYDEKDMTKKRQPHILLECVVLASERQGDPVGSVHFHNLNLGNWGGGPLTDTDREMTLNALVGLGILRKEGEKVIDPETKTTRINTATLTDRINKIGHFIGHLTFQAGKEKPADKQRSPGEKYPDRFGFIWGRGMFRADDPEVANAPRSKDPKYAVKPVTPPAPSGTAQPTKDGEPRRDANNAKPREAVSAGSLDTLDI